MVVIEQYDRYLPFKNLHSQLDSTDFNNIVYLLKKFKKLTYIYSLGIGEIVGDFGNFTVSGNLQYVNNKYRIGNNGNVHIVGFRDEIFSNAKYTFIFTIVSENTDGNVDNRKYIVELESSELIRNGFNLSSDILGENEYILPDFEVDVIFNVS